MAEVSKSERMFIESASGYPTPKIEKLGKAPAPYMENTTEVEVDAVGVDEKKVIYMNRLREALGIKPQKLVEQKPIINIGDYKRQK